MTDLVTGLKLFVLRIINWTFICLIINIIVNNLKSYNYVQKKMTIIK